MKKWAFALAAGAIVVIGCGGGNGKTHGGTTGTTSTTSGSQGSFVNLPNTPGLLNFTYLSGAGRASGDPSAIINRAIVQDTQVIQTSLNPNLVIKLNGYTNQTIHLNVPTTNSRFFSQYFLNIFQMKVENDAGGFDFFSGPPNQDLVNAVFPANIRVFPGRITNVSVRLDDTMLHLDDSNQPTFESDVFAAVNENPDTSTINGFLADYVMFDISNLPFALKPDLPAGGKADRVYFSGDNYAVSNSGNNGVFNVFTNLGFVEGVFNGPTAITGFGTYTLVQPDPRDPDPNTLLRITALQGEWYFLDNVVKNKSDFEVITFPHSDDDNLQDLVLVQFTNGVIVNMYFGQCDLQAGTLEAFPIADVSPGSAQGEIDGTVSDFKDKNGIAIATSSPNLVRTGTYTLTNGDLGSNGGVVPTGFNASGRFIVFRR